MNVPCRAAVSEDCQIYADREDGTYDGSTVVCMKCYAHLLKYTPSGRGLLPELPQAIADAKSGVEPKPRTKPDPILDELDRIFRSS